MTEITPSLVRTDESGEDDTMFARGLLGLGIGRGLGTGGVKAGSIFQGETLSGRGMEEVSSHLTYKPKGFIFINDRQLHTQEMVKDKHMHFKHHCMSHEFQDRSDQ